MYKIQITSNNPEFDVPGPFENGYDCDGYLLVPFKDGDSCSTSIVQANIMMLAEAIANNHLMMEAAYIADGLVKARQYKNNRAKNKFENMLRQVREHLGHLDDDEDEEDD